MNRATRVALLVGGAMILTAARKIETPTVLVPSKPLKPGHTLVLEVPNRLFRPPALTWEQQTVPFYQARHKVWRALIRVPLTLGAGPSAPSVIIPLGMSNKTVTIQPTIEVLPSDFGEETLSFPDDKARLLNNPSEDLESKRIREKLKEALSDKTQLWSGRFEKPVPGEILSPYGIKRNKIGQDKPDFHRGVDLRANQGEPVRASNHARVLMAERLKFHGNTVLLSHGQGIGSIYIHLESLAVKEGEKVKKGQVIGSVGSTGLATAPHLHWGVYVHGKAVDPEQWLEEKF